eukprot:746976-Hanusia_phi.AAC.7
MVPYVASVEFYHPQPPHPLHARAQRRCANAPDAVPSQVHLLQLTAGKQPLRQVERSCWPDADHAGEEAAQPREEAEGSGENVRRRVTDVARADVEEEETGASAHSRGGPQQLVADAGAAFES